MRTTSWCTWVVAVVAFAPVGLAAQSTSPVAAVAYAPTPPTVSSPTDAAQLEADALSQGEAPTELAQAADLFRRAAALRPSADPVAVNDLIQSARFSFYSGKRVQAMKDFAAAADVALRQGDIVRAAESFIDAAWVAQQLRDGTQAARYAQRARALSASLRLGEDDRARLMARLPR